MKRRRETKEERRKRAASVVRAMRKRYPDAATALTFSNPFELLVAKVLAAQCTDKKVNEVTPVLFKKYKGPAEFARARTPSLEKIIKPTGFFRNKTRSLIGLGRALVERHGDALGRRGARDWIGKHAAHRRHHAAAEQEAVFHLLERR